MNDPSNDDNRGLLARVMADGRSLDPKELELPFLSAWETLLAASRSDSGKQGPALRRRLQQKRRVEEAIDLLGAQAVLLPNDAAPLSTESCSFGV